LSFGGFRSDFGQNFFFHGLLDEVTVYSRVLGASEVLAIFTAGRAGKCTERVDADGDGILNTQDACPNSELSDTVGLAECESEISNPLFPSGCSLTDLLLECVLGARRHRQFVQCVNQLTNTMQRLNMLTDPQRDALQACAAQADLP